MKSIKGTNFRMKLVIH